MKLEYSLRQIEPTVVIFDMTALLRGSSQTHLGTQDAVGGRSHHQGRLDQMRKRTPRGRCRWGTSSVKMLLDRARQNGLLRETRPSSRESQPCPADAPNVTSTFLGRCQCGIRSACCCDGLHPCVPTERNHATREWMARRFLRLQSEFVLLFRGSDPSSLRSDHAGAGSRCLICATLWRMAFYASY